MIGNKEVMAKNIKRLMDEKGVKAIDVCRALAIKQPTFSDWLNAKTYPRIDKIELMARYFGVSKAALVEDQGNVKEFILSNDEKIVIRTMRNDQEFKNHLVKYAKMRKVYVVKKSQKPLKQMVAAKKRAPK